MRTHVLDRLRQELGSPRLSALHSTLGLAVPRAALASLGDKRTGEAPPDSARTGDDGRAGPRSR